MRKEAFGIDGGQHKATTRSVVRTSFGLGADMWVEDVRKRWEMNWSGGQFNVVYGVHESVPFNICFESLYL